MKRTFTYRPVIASTDFGVTKLHVTFYPFERLRQHTLDIVGEDLLDALKNLTQLLKLPVTRAEIESAGMTADEVLNKLAAENGNRFDFIVSIKDKATGKIYMNSDYFEEPDAIRIDNCRSIESATSVSNDVVAAVEEELSDTFEDNLVVKIASKLGGDTSDEMGVNDNRSAKAKQATARYEKARKEYIEAVADMLFLW